MSAERKEAPASSGASKQTSRTDHNDSAQILDVVEKFVRRFVVMSDVQAWFTALWIAHTHCKFDPDDCTFRTTPYLWISSATKESGKTTLLRVLRSLSHRSLLSGSISTGALNRVVEAERPTLLLDELDATLRGNKEKGEAIRQLLNSGFEYDGTTMLCIGQNNDVTTLSTYCPKALAGIGELWDTVESRSIPVRLERKQPEERVEYFDRDVIDRDAKTVKAEIATWVEQHEPSLRCARPESELDGRVKDLWRPLLAIADAAGGHWPARARQAAIELSTGEAREDNDLGVRLLADIRTVFDESAAQALRSADLIAKLAAIEESSWGEWGRTGKPISVHKLSSLLHPWRIKTMSVWVEGAKAQGYKREQFERFWASHLPTPVGGSSSSRGSRSESRSYAAPTASTTPTSPQGRRGADGSSGPNRGTEDPGLHDRGDGDVDTNGDVSEMCEPTFSVAFPQDDPGISPIEIERLLEMGVQVRAFPGGAGSDIVDTTDESHLHGSDPPAQRRRLDGKERWRLIRTYRPEVERALYAGQLTPSELQEIAQMLKLQERTGVITPSGIPIVNVDDLRNSA